MYYYIYYIKNIILEIFFDNYFTQKQTAPMQIKLQRTAMYATVMYKVLKTLRPPHLLNLYVTS
jgi:hypothetical protein